MGMLDLTSSLVEVINAIVQTNLCLWDPTLSTTNQCSDYIRWQGMTFIQILVWKVIFKVT